MTIPLISDEQIVPLAIQAHDGILVVPVQNDLYETTLKQLERDLLTKIHETECYLILMDISQVFLMDSYVFERLVEIIGMAGLMGGQTLIVGMQPGVASALVILDVDVTKIDTVVSMEQGYARFAALKEVAAGTVDETRQDAEELDEQSDEEDTLLMNNEDDCVSAIAQTDKGA